MGVMQQHIAFSARGESPLVVGVGGAQILADSVDHTLWSLSSTGPVEERCRLPLDLASKRRVLAAYRFDVMSQISGACFGFHRVVVPFLGCFLAAQMPITR